jgi:hypothetical protein
MKDGQGELDALVPAHFLAASRDGSVLGREVNAANVGELLQQMANLSSACQGAGVAEKETVQTPSWASCKGGCG